MGAQSHNCWFFETTNTFGNAIALQFNDVLAKYELAIWIIAYVKNEGDNLNIMTTTLISIISCETLGLQTPFVGACWGHVESMQCQNASNMP